MALATWFTLPELEKLTGIDLSDLYDAAEKGELKVSYFGTKNGVAKTTDFEFNEWSRRRLYTKKELRLLSQLTIDHDEISVRDKIKKMKSEIKAANE